MLQSAPLAVPVNSVVSTVVQSGDGKKIFSTENAMSSLGGSGGGKID